ncbi:Uu.00g022950.m01.CDS01 [Anthostomella pinea]|uniref:Uu.00g022950.m01.CDS01 n=1 Tax=Anthostomella pinea TaxID=933095 RepID=A0AAI8VZY8_9PEZI|nr:Uu.00g022950.m01.CDS01 [Anthostomella pinea]
MGIGAKLKDAISGDKDTKHTDTTTSGHATNTYQTLGSSPAGDTSHTHGTAHTTPSTTHHDRGDHSGHGADGLTSSKNPESTHGIHPSTTSTSDAAGPGGLDRYGDQDFTHEQSRATGLRQPNVSAADAAPYDKHRHKKARSRDATGSHNTPPYWGEDAARVSGGRKDHGGMTGTGSHGLTHDERNPTHAHGTYNGVTGTSSQKYPAPGSSNAAHNDSGSYGRDHGISGAGSSGSALPHRPHDAGTGNTSHDRDHKIHEYDAPSNSEGRGHTGGAGLCAAGAGAAAGYGASEMAGRHHREGREGGHDAYASQNRGDGLTGNDHATKPGMLDPYQQPQSHAHAPLSQTQPRHGMHDPTYDNQPSAGNTQAIPGSVGGHSSDPSESRLRHGGSGPDSASIPAGPGSGAGNDMGDDHHGPGHAGAKVVHQCEHCGKDNDISRYFKKEAVYRMS